MLSLAKVRYALIVDSTLIETYETYAEAYAVWSQRFEGQFGFIVRFDGLTILS